MAEEPKPSGRDLLAERPIEGTGPATILLGMAAFGAVLIGLILLSQATYGVGLIAAGCFLGIMARIAQAGAHHRAIMKAAREPRVS